MLRGEPPLRDVFLYHHGEWWGSPFCLMKSQKVTDDAFVQKEEPQLQRVLDISTANLPGEPLRLGKPRWSQSEWAFCERPIEGHPGFSVDTDFLDYASAETRPDEWRLVESSLAPAKGSAGMQVVGLRDGEPVALIAPRKEGEF